MNGEEVLAEAAKAATVAQAQPETVADTKPETHESAPEQEVADNEAPAETTITPEEEVKKLRNALSRRERSIGKLAAQKNQALEELQQLRAKAATPQQERRIVQDNKGIPTKLNMNDFQNYADFIEARAAEIAEHHIDRKFAERDGQHQETQKANKEQAWAQQRQESLKTEAESYLKDNPSAKALLEEFGDVEFPDHVTKAFLEADPIDTIKAFVNLAKAGKLEDLADMTPARAAIEIGKAMQSVAPPPKTKAPTPLATSRSSVASGKPYEKFSPREALELLTRKKD